jgi:hypothetical protein
MHTEIDKSKRSDGLEKNNKCAFNPCCSEVKTKEKMVCKEDFPDFEIYMCTQYTISVVKYKAFALILKHMII